MRKYVVKYKDKFGEEKTEICSDGSTISLTLRGIKFEGDDFDLLEGKVDDDKFEYIKYADGSGDLTNFRMKIIFPIKIFHQTKIITENMAFEIEIGKTNNINKLSPNSVELNTPFGFFSSKKTVGLFWNSMIEIQNMLPKNTQIKTCFSCTNSDYHPLGGGMFGALLCFKNLQKDFNNASNNLELTNLIDKGWEEGTIFNVQETFDCSEHRFYTKKW